MTDQFIYLITNDQRIHDNPILEYLTENKIKFLPVYIFNKKEFENTNWGFNRMGPIRLKFLLESLKELNDKFISESGSGLNIFFGDPKDVLLELKKQIGISKLIKSKQYSYYETEFEKEIQKEFNLKLIESFTLFEISDLPFQIENTPRSFTKFRKQVEKNGTLRLYGELQGKLNILKNVKSDLPKEINAFIDKTKLIYDGGESKGLERLKYYLWDTNAIETYKETRNSLMGDTFSGKFSPWLSNGNLSPLKIWFEVEEYESKVKSNQSTYWMKFELLWREYFKYIALQNSKNLFMLNGFKDYTKYKNKDLSIFENWKSGNTEHKLINAFMNEIHDTGFMSNRGRQIVASYFVKDLGMDWRIGAAWFEHLLIDYDSESNWGNWAYQAGVGNDPIDDRRFNPDLQMKKFDPNGEFVKSWS